MGTFGGDLLRILAHGGMNMGTSALGQYLGNVWGGEKELKNWLAKQLYEAATTQPAEQQVNIQQAIEQLGGGKLPMAERIKSLSGGGLPGVTPELRGQGVSSKGAPLSFPIDKFKSLSEVPTGITPEVAKYIISPPVKLEQQVAAEVAGTPGASPLATLMGLKRADQPRGEFASLAALASSHPDPLVRTAALAKLNQPSEMMQLRQDMEIGRTEDREARRTDAMQRHLDNLGVSQMRLSLMQQEAARRGDESEQNALGKVLAEHKNYTKAFGDVPYREDVVLEAGRAYNQAREAYAKRYPNNPMLPPPHEEKIVRGFFGGTSQKTIRPSEKTPATIPTKTTAPTLEEQLSRIDTLNLSPEQKEVYKNRIRTNAGAK